MAITMLFDQINDVKSLFNKTSNQLEAEKAKTYELRKLIECSLQEEQKDVETIGNLTMY